MSYSSSGSPFPITAILPLSPPWNPLAKKTPAPTVDRAVTVGGDSNTPACRRPHCPGQAFSLQCAGIVPVYARCGYKSKQGVSEGCRQRSRAADNAPGLQTTHPICRQRTRSADSAAGLQTAQPGCRQRSRPNVSPATIFVPPADPGAQPPLPLGEGRGEGAHHVGDLSLQCA